MFRLVTHHDNIKGFGLTHLFGDCRGCMPPRRSSSIKNKTKQIKTKQIPEANVKLIDHVSSWVTCNSSRERRTLTAVWSWTEETPPPTPSSTPPEGRMPPLITLLLQGCSRAPHQLTTKRQCRLWCRRRGRGVVRFE